MACSVPRLQKQGLRKMQPLVMFLRYANFATRNSSPPDRSRPEEGLFRFRGKSEKVVRRVRSSQL